MIFAAGLGTRLKPLTNTMPKALVPVGGKPLLQHTIEKLIAAGFNEIIINIHHFGQQIIDFAEENQRFGIRIEFSDERDKLLDTGGGIGKAAWFFNDNQPFLLHNVDILSNIDLDELYNSHLKRNSLATLVCSKRQTSRYLLFDRNNRLRGLTNEKTGETKSPFPDFNPKQYRKLAFAGIQILRPSIFRYMDDFPDKFSIIDLYLSICDKETVTCYFPDNLKVIDVGKIDSLQESERLLNQIL